MANVGLWSQNLHQKRKYKATPSFAQPPSYFGAVCNEGAHSLVEKG